MKSSASTVEGYFAELPEERKEAISKLRSAILSGIPNGFEETITYGMVSYVVPHSLYPGGYHCDPKQPLPFLSFASQKNFIAVYHMGLYADEALLQWFTNEFSKRSSSKLDMGKSCIRFKKPGQIPFDLIAELVSKISAAEWIEVYESRLKNS